MAKKKKNLESEQVNKALETALSLTGLESSMTVVDTVTDLLQNQEALAELVEIVAGGGSIDSVEQSLGIIPGMLDRWLRLGQIDNEGPYRALYLFYARASSQARRTAESALLVKNPDRWLDRVEMQSRLKQEPATPAPPAGEIPGKVSSEDSEPSDGLEYLDVDTLHPTEEKES